MSWRLAPALAQLRREANAAWPGRSTASDGTIGDADHRSRASDHNPDAEGWVDALDLTHDPANGADMGRLVDAIVERRDRRVAYIIWNGQLWRSYRTSSSHPPPWTPEPYRGTNPHRTHAHFSVVDAHRGDTSTWLAAPEDDMTPEQDQRLRNVEGMLGYLTAADKQGYALHGTKGKMPLHWLTANGINRILATLAQADPDKVTVDIPASEWEEGARAIASQVVSSLDPKELAHLIVEAGVGAAVADEIGRRVTG